MFARILDLGPTERGARQTGKRDVDRALASAAAARDGDAAGAAAALGFTLR